MRVCTADGFPFVSNFQLNLLAHVFCETTKPIHPWSPWWIHWHASIKRYDLAQNIGWSTKPSICHFGNICTSLTILRLCQILIVFIMARQFCAPPLSRLSWEVGGIVEMLRNCFFLWIIRHGLHFMRPTSDSCAPNNTAIENQGWIREEWIRFLAFDKKTDNAIDERRGALSIRGQNKRSSLKITLFCFFFIHNLNLT